jgi:hypothetical protein
MATAHLLLTVLCASSSAAVLLPAARSGVWCAVRHRGPLMAEDKSSAGKGFGASSRYAAEEARGREALEKMKAASADRGYDSTLQGLQDAVAEPEPSPEVIRGSNLRQP